MGHFSPFLQNRIESCTTSIFNGLPTRMMSAGVGLCRHLSGPLGHNLGTIQSRLYDQLGHNYGGILCI